MSIADKIMQIADWRQAIRRAIEDKGVPVPPGTMPDQYPGLIRAIVGEGGAEPGLPILSVPTIQVLPNRTFGAVYSVEEATQVEVVWLLDGVEIYTGTQYQAPPEASGSLRVRVDASNESGQTARTSAPYTLYTALPPVLLSAELLHVGGRTYAAQYELQNDGVVTVRWFLDGSQLFIGDMVTVPGNRSGLLHALVRAANEHGFHELRTDATTVEEDVTAPAAITLSTIVAPTTAFHPEGVI